MNTRFYPTLNGECHWGHLLVALLNYHQAKANGGIFIVRSELRISYLSHDVTMGQMQKWQDSFKRVFDLVGIEAEYMPLLHDAQWIEENLAQHKELHLSDIKNDLYPEYPQGFTHPYSPMWCLERVLLDNRYAIGSVIRGMDLLSENSLYVHFCKQLNLPVPKMGYCPLVHIKQDDKVTVVSKSNKNGVLKDVHKYQVLAMMEKCLIDPSNGFVLSNIKKNPIINS
jgi:glutamyl/glutaminyl-tRNA synthetase